MFFIRKIITNNIQMDSVNAQNYVNEYVKAYQGVENKLNKSSIKNVVEIA